MFAHWLFDQIVARNHIFPCTARLPRGIGQQKKGWGAFTAAQSELGRRFPWIQQTGHERYALQLL